MAWFLLRTGSVDGTECSEVHRKICDFACSVRRGSTLSGAFAHECPDADTAGTTGVDALTRSAAVGTIGRCGANRVWRGWREVGRALRRGRDGRVGTPGRGRVDTARSETAATGAGPSPHCSFVARALVPAAQFTPLASEYIARSTTICAGGAPMLSIEHAEPLAARPRGSRAAGTTLERLLGGSGKSRVIGAVPSSNSSVTRGRAGERRRVGDEHVGLGVARPADLALGQRPARCRCVGLAGAVVRLVPGGRRRPGPPHRALDDDRARRWSSVTRVGQRDVGQPGLLSPPRC